MLLEPAPRASHCFCGILSAVQPCTLTHVCADAPRTGAGRRTTHVTHTVPTRRWPCEATWCACSTRWASAHDWLRAAQRSTHGECMSVRAVSGWAAACCHYMLWESSCLLPPCCCVIAFTHAHIAASHVGLCWARQWRMSCRHSTCCSPPMMASSRTRHQPALPTTAHGEQPGPREHRPCPPINSLDHPCPGALPHQVPPR